MSAPSNRTYLTAVTTIVALSLVGLVAWRYMPRPKPVASESMKAASAELTQADEQGAPRPPEPPKQPKSERDALMKAAWALKGIPYVFGSKGPEALDCSGFTKVAYEAVGVTLPDGSFNQAEGEQALESVDQLTRGDLLFYRWAGHDGVSHVTMYAGDGWVIGTGSPGQPKRVVVYPITDDLANDGRVITFRHIPLKDEEAE